MRSKVSFSNAFKDGILLLLPFGVTLGLIYWGWSILRAFIPDLSIILPKSISTHPYLNNILDFLYLLVIIVFITIVGMLASTFLGKFFRFLIDKILMRPTFIRPIYTTFKKITESILQEEGNPLTKGISESILVPYPNQHTQSIGFITSNHARHLLGEEEGDKWITLYVPSAPVVSAGFFLLCKKENTAVCKLSSGQAMTTIISIGAASNVEIDTPVLENIVAEKKPNIFQVWFLNGLLLLIPIMATIAMLSWVFNYLYVFITNISRLLPNILPINIPQQYYELIINFIIFILLALLIMIIGFLGESAFGLWVKSLSHKFFNSIPIINNVYSIVEQITRVFSPDPSKSSTFDKAVLIPFPTSSTYAIGFITGKDCSNITTNDINNCVPIFIPTTPIPTTGWFFMVSEDQLIPLDMPVEKAFGLVISAGILTEDTEDT